MVAETFQPKVGDLVNVVSRTWPGINKPGGVGKVTKVHIDDDVLAVDVDYVLGGSDKAVELEFVKEQTFEEENHGRPSRRRRSTAAAKEEKAVVPVPVSPLKKTKGKKKKALKDASSKANKGDKRKKLSAVIQPEKSKKTKKSTTCSSVSKTGEEQSKKNPSKAKKIPETKPKQKSNATTKKMKKRSPVVPEEESKPTVAAAKAESPLVAHTPGFLKNVYTDMSKKAASFVSGIIGKTPSGSGSQSGPSSPESTASLDLKMENERAERFNAIFSDIMRQKMAETIEMDDLRTEVNNICKDEPFSELELRSQLDRLDKESKVMVTWDTGTIYCL